GLLNDPQRCPSCRAVAKRARTVGGPREFHAAICGSCGGQAMVPFAPRNDHRLASAAAADRRVELPRSTDGSGPLRDRSARRAPLRVVEQAFAREKCLLAGGEGELLRA